MIRLFENKNTYDINCQDIADLLNEVNSSSRGESSYRKFFKAFDKGRKYARENVSDESLILQLQEIKKEKFKLFDERKELNKQLRNQARLEDRMDKIECSLVSNGSSKFEIKQSIKSNGENDLLVCLSDLHIGATYYTAFGYYDSEIAKERLQKYLENIINIKNTHKSENCYVALLGDMISGSIHLDLTVSNRENIIEQVKIASELITNFVYELSKHFNNVCVYSVDGNHSRLSSKEDSIKDERLDNLIPWYLKSTLKHIKNVSVKDDRMDSTVDVITIRDLTYAIVHGDLDSSNKSAIARLSDLIGFKPYAIVAGHLHHCCYDGSNAIKFIRNGSLGGSGDDYTIQKRLYGKPNQMTCVCNSNGVVACYPVEL